MPRGFLVKRKSHNTTKTPSYKQYDNSNVLDAEELEKEVNKEETLEDCQEETNNNINEENQQVPLINTTTPPHLYPGFTATISDYPSAFKGFPPPPSIPFSLSTGLDKDGRLRSPLLPLHTAAVPPPLFPLFAPPPPPSLGLSASPPQDLSPSSTSQSPTSPTAFPSPPNFGFPPYPMLYRSAFERLALSSPYNKSGAMLLSRDQSEALNLSNKLSPTAGAEASKAMTSQMISSPNKRRHSDNDLMAAHSSVSSGKAAKTPKKTKAMRKIAFTEELKTSPVSGTFIRDEDDRENTSHLVQGDIDSSFNLVEITAEAKAELAKIDSKIGDYVCQLCKEKYDDAFQLAQHRCSRIVHVEYRCPECNKVFNCPANLASHRRWHKPRPGKEDAKGRRSSAPAAAAGSASAEEFMKTQRLLQQQVNEDMTSTKESSDEDSTSGGSGVDDSMITCPHQSCGKKFKRQSYLRKHELLHHSSQRRSLPTEKLLSTQQPTSLGNAPHLPPCYGSRLMTSPPLLSSTTAALMEQTTELLRHHASAMASAMTSSYKDLVVCELCHCALPSKEALDQHLSQMHAREVNHCKYCPSMFYSATGLARHVNKSHASDSRLPGDNRLLLQLPTVVRPC